MDVEGKKKPLTTVTRPSRTKNANTTQTKPSGILQNSDKDGKESTSRKSVAFKAKVTNPYSPPQGAPDWHSKKTGGTKEDQEIHDDFLYQIIKIWES